MSTIAAAPSPTLDDRRISQTIATVSPRLREFVRRRVRDVDDAEDIVQDALAELVAAARLMTPIEHATRWVQRVARNRIIDRFRRRQRRAPTDAASLSAADDERVLDEWLGSPGDGPEAAYTRSILIDEIAAALEELPASQRAAFVGHEIDGRSFREMAAESGIPVNTLLGRKHAAVQFLRERLEAIRAEFSE